MLLIPFVYNMDQLTGAVFLCAMHAVVHTGGSIPSILIGVPGDGPAAATALDGYAMTKKGEAGRALGASFGASTIGGLLGAIFLGLSLPILEPIILSFSPAEFFLLAILGITFIATLSGSKFPEGNDRRSVRPDVRLYRTRSVHRQSALCFRSVVAVGRVVGDRRRAGDVCRSRNDFAGREGPRVRHVAGASRCVAESQGQRRTARRGRRPCATARSGTGMRDVLQHKWLVLRCSLLVAAIGIIPGLGGDAASWMAYGHTVQSSKHPERFGKGEVAGVIGAETGSCAKEAGSLLPTLFFGVPGSSGMAIMLGAFLMLGIQPGPTMLTDHINIVWSLIWALVIANVICVVMLIAAGPWIGKLGSAKASFLIPYVLVFALLGCYLFQGNWQNLILVLVMGSLGYLFKRHDWPRAPFIIGVILGKIAEDSLLKAIGIWGPSFFWRPISLVLIGLILASIGFYMWRSRRPAVVPSHA